MPNTKIRHIEYWNPNFGRQDFDIPARYGMKKVEISSFGRQEGHNNYWLGMITTLCDVIYINKVSCLS